MMFSIIIPNYNGKKFLRQCLKLVNDPLVKEIIIIDNGSTDGSVKYLKKKRGVRKIFNSRNLGFAKAVNQGINLAKSDYLVVMNNDLRVKKGWFKVMTSAVEKWQKKEKIGAYFGKVLDWEGKRIESAGLEFWIKGKTLNRGNGKIDNLESYNQEEFIFGSSASIIIYYKPALLEVGLFDEDFFAYEEDVDLALRLNEKGWKTLYIPKAISYHLGGGTSKQMGNLRQRLDLQNWWRIIIKNYPSPVIIKYLPEILIERLRNLSWLIRSTPWHRLPFDLLRTYGELMVELPRILKKREPLAFLNNYETTN